MSGQRSVLAQAPLLLLLLLCCEPLPAESSDEALHPFSEPFSPSCFSHTLNTTLDEGQQMLLPDCGGIITCTERFGLLHDGCPGQRSNTCHRLEPSAAGPDAPFPRCCPRLTCDGCFLTGLGRYLSPGEMWTDSNCVRHTCHIQPSGGQLLLREACKRPGPPPPLGDCELLGQDASRGEYPLCCAYYRCPGHCLSKNEKWLSTEQSEATNSCTVEQELA